MSNVTHITNRNILYLFAILVAMSIACSIGGLGFAVCATYYKLERTIIN